MYLSRRSSVVERFLGKKEVKSPILFAGSTNKNYPYFEKGQFCF